MSNEGSSIKIQSQSETPNAPLNVNLNDFKIETLTNIIHKEELNIAGTINGEAEIRDLATNPVFTSDLTIANLAVSKDTVGDVKIKVNNKITNTYTADVSITGQGNQVNLTGNYKSDIRSFDLNLDLEKLNMTSVQAFTVGNLKDSEGYLSGHFKVTGTATDPNINGNLQFNDVGFRVTQLNSYFKSINDNIIFNESGITFNDFKVEDEKDNLLTINGKIATTNYTAFGFNMTVDAENFRAINSKG